ncbi:Uncharacterized conserved protein YqhQ [Geosporobacter subterraneus DSM 17957]|uniref:Uncharacterized conserved protein YqhQ n=1 Tax=Geosporobacter subterraneus DSM 17957 TaxID=1121919 RepID=A0A1M6MSC0_9FIRM|nr:DUF1385 domain-containing protein [Geosporobacter subterraneus]SHJ86425.1 Uncharacterized conserved protein YqhQ [Geosporobacter subterraneus DSM 17957]
MDQDKIFIKSATPRNVGGQAVIEGVMMKGPKDIAIAVRKPDKEIVIKKEAIQGMSKSAISKLPVFRGVVALVDSMVLGVKSLTYSAEFFEEYEDTEEKGKIEQWIENRFGDKANDIMLYFSVFIAMALAILIFIISPTLVTTFLKRYINNSLGLNIVEGVLRITLFISYVLLISQMKDIQRVFQYHGAEHKTIHCYESGQELTVDNVRSFTTLHPRCGTSFMLIVMVISMILFTMIGWPNPWIRILSRFILLPVVAGISYEIIRWAGRSQSKLVCMISYPGLMLQKLTTREPDDSQLEVAIAALKNVLVEDKEADLW